VTPTPPPMDLTSRVKHFAWPTLLANLARRPPLAPGTLAASVTSAAMIAQQVAGKAVRDALFLSSFRAIHLPHAMALGAALSLVTVACMPRIAARLSPRRLMPLVFALSALGFVLEWTLFSFSPRLGALAVYLQTTVLGPVIISTFWSLINESFDPHTAKPAVARIALGGTIGGVIGGLAAWRAATLVSVPRAILLLATINLSCLIGIVVLRSATRANKAPLSQAEVLADDHAVSPVRVLRDAPFLRNLAILVAIGAIVSSLLDYVFSAQAVAHYGGGHRLLAFFSIFGFAVSVLSLLLQVSLGRIAMEKVGLAVNIAVLPGLVVLGGAAGLAVPGVLSASLLRGAEMVQRNTLFRSAYELLYTPLPELQKRTTKALIDVGFDRLGTLVGSLVTMLVVYAIAPSQTVLLVVAVLLSAATFPVVRQLHAGYVEALEERLRDGEARLAQADDELDGAAASMDGDRARDILIHRAAILEILEHPEDQGGPAAKALANPQPLVDLAADVLSRDSARARAALRRLDARTRPAAGPAILLLAHKELHLEARAALRGLAPAVIGQLVDAMVDPEMDFVVRRRIPPILAVCRTQRAADGLLLALADVRFEVRYAAGRALMRMADGNPDIILAQEKIVQLVLAEVAREQQVVSEIDEESLADEATAPLDVVIRDRVSRGLEHLFTILALLLDRQALRMAFRALHQQDDRHRGTALEYLQTVLPTELRDAVWPLISESGPLPSPRPPSEVLADLAKVVRLEREDAPRARKLAEAAASS
jgi:ATP:ADP antiporter, AAA family